MTPIIESGTDEGESSVSGIILAGGDSRRMGGINKALLQVGGRPIIEREAEVLCRVFQEVVLITNTPEDFRFLDLPMFRDLFPGKGALGGLYTGLMSIKARQGVLVGCDMPFLNGRILSRLAELATAGRQDVLIPRINGRLQPMHAVYSKGCVAHIVEHMHTSDLTILNFFHAVDVVEVQQADLSRFDLHCRFVMNINTPADLERARQIADQEDLTSRT